jgi:hypothetical protein
MGIGRVRIKMPERAVKPPMTLPKNVLLAKEADNMFTRDGIHQSS